MRRKKRKHKTRVGDLFKRLGGRNPSTEEINEAFGEDLEECNNKFKSVGRVFQTKGKCLENLSKELTKLKLEKGVGTGETTVAKAQATASLAESIAAGVASGGGSLMMAPLSEKELSGLSRLGFGVGLKPLSSAIGVYAQNMDLQQITKTRLHEVMTYQLTICRLLFATLPDISYDDEGMKIHLNSFIFNKIYRYIKKSEEVIPVLLVTLNNEHLEDVELSSYYFVRLLNMALRLTNSNDKDNRIYKLLSRNVYYLISIFYKGIVGVNQPRQNNKNNKLEGFRTMMLRLRLDKPGVERYFLAVLRIITNKYTLSVNPSDPSDYDMSSFRALFRTFEALDLINKLKTRYESVIKAMDYEKFYNGKFKANKQTLKNPLNDTNFKVLQTQIFGGYSRTRGWGRGPVRGDYADDQKKEYNKIVNSFHVNIFHALQMLVHELRLVSKSYLTKVATAVYFVARHQDDLKSVTTPTQHMEKVNRLANSVTFRFNDIGTYMTVLPSWWVKGNDGQDPRLKGLEKRDDDEDWLNVSGVKGFDFDDKPPSYEQAKKSLERLEEGEGKNELQSELDRKIIERDILYQQIDKEKRDMMNKGEYRKLLDAATNNIKEQELAKSSELEPLVTENELSTELSNQLNPLATRDQLKDLAKSSDVKKLQANASRKQCEMILGVTNGVPIRCGLPVAMFLDERDEPQYSRFCYKHLCTRKVQLGNQISQEEQVKFKSLDDSQDELRKKCDPEDIKQRKRHTIFVADDTSSNVQQGKLLNRQPIIRF